MRWLVLIFIIGVIHWQEAAFAKVVAPRVVFPAETEEPFFAFYIGISKHSEHINFVTAVFVPQLSGQFSKRPIALNGEFVGFSPFNYSVAR